MAVSRIVSLSALCLIGLNSMAFAADKPANSYVYTPPISEALTVALQTPVQMSAAQAAPIRRADRKTGPFQKTLAPGAIRPASYILPSQDTDKRHGRNYVCGDSQCKQRLPAYNSQTPLEEERGHLGTN